MVPVRKSYRPNLDQCYYDTLCLVEFSKENKQLLFSLHCALSPIDLRLQNE